MRLACVRRAANVRSEPGSNSPVEKLLSGKVRRPSRSLLSLVCAKSKDLTVRLETSRVCASTSRCTRLCVSLRFSFQGSSRGALAFSAAALVSKWPCSSESAYVVKNLFSRPRHSQHFTRRATERTLGECVRRAAESLFSLRPVRRREPTSSSHSRAVKDDPAK